MFQNGNKLYCEVVNIELTSFPGLTSCLRLLNGLSTESLSLRSRPEGFCCWLLLVVRGAILPSTLGLWILVRLSTEATNLFSGERSRFLDGSSSLSSSVSFINCDLDLVILFMVVVLALSSAHLSLNLSLSISLTLSLHSCKTSRSCSLLSSFSFCNCSMMSSFSLAFCLKLSSLLRQESLSNGVSSISSSSSSHGIGPSFMMFSKRCSTSSRASILVWQVANSALRVAFSATADS